MDTLKNTAEIRLIFVEQAGNIAEHDRSCSMMLPSLNSKTVFSYLNVFLLIHQPLSTDLDAFLPIFAVMVLRC
jgi:hypothetical protein